MRTADLHRVEKAFSHLNAARTLLTNIKWENRSEKEDYFIREATEGIEKGQSYLEDIIHTI